MNRLQQMQKRIEKRDAKRKPFFSIARHKQQIIWDKRQLKAQKDVFAL
jgi:hypothetical protein